MLHLRMCKIYGLIRFYIRRGRHELQRAHWGIRRIAFGADWLLAWLPCLVGVEDCCNLANLLVGMEDFRQDVWR